MTTPIHPMTAHGYKMPIPRSPATDFMLEDEREYQYITAVQAAHDNKEEDIPAPYAYTAIMFPDADREALKAKFMAACNQRRWQYIRNAETKVKK